MGLEQFLQWDEVIGGSTELRKTLETSLEFRLYENTISYGRATDSGYHHICKVFRRVDCSVWHSQQDLSLKTSGGIVIRIGPVLIVQRHWYQSWHRGGDYIKEMLARQRSKTRISRKLKMLTCPAQNLGRKAAFSSTPTVS